MGVKLSCFDRLETSIVEGVVVASPSVADLPFTELSPHDEVAGCGGWELLQEARNVRGAG